ncbi:MAG TPA: plastocyanin/azurin family copper-binding protein [Polyangiaceae bacterium]|nr:plastocyanin/azurin family copper-binding protein [Polyangiaceae bacterium]
MPLSRPASLPQKLVALLALSLACVRCSNDPVDSGASSSAGSPESAGAHGEAGASERAGAGNSADEGGASGEGSTGQAGAGSEAAGQGGSGEEPADTIPTFNGCAAADYEDQSALSGALVIQIAANGLNFSPRCLLIAAGQTVRFEGSLSAHPLAPGNPAHADAGSADGPIRATSSGSSVEFTFPTPGTFPYYCELHSFGEGEGMAGVVHVKP